MFCEQNPQISVALEITEDLPPTDFLLSRWYAEPVKAVIIPTDIFLSNKQNCPVLSKRHKAFLMELFRHRVQVIIRGEDDLAVIPGQTPLAPLPLDGPFGCAEGEAPLTKGAPAKITPYLNYVARLFQSRPAPTPAEQFELPYHDYLQAPLQPLQDNLESQTYETFERDPVKYASARAAPRRRAPAPRPLRARIVSESERVVS